MSVSVLITNYFEETSVREGDEYTWKRRNIYPFVNETLTEMRSRDNSGSADLFPFHGVDSKSIKSGLEMIRINFGVHAIRAIVKRCARPYWNILILDTCFGVGYDRMDPDTGRPLHGGASFKDAYLTLLALPADDMDTREFSLPFAGHRRDAIDLARVVDNCDWETP